VSPGDGKMRSRHCQAAAGSPVGAVERAFSLSNVPVPAQQRLRILPRAGEEVSSSAGVTEDAPVGRLRLPLRSDGIMYLATRPRERVQPPTARLLQSASRCRTVRCVCLFRVGMLNSTPGRPAVQSVPERMAAVGADRELVVPAMT